MELNEAMKIGDSVGGHLKGASTNLGECQDCVFQSCLGTHAGFHAARRRLSIAGSDHFVFWFVIFDDLSSFVFTAFLFFTSYVANYVVSNPPVDLLSGQAPCCSVSPGFLLGWALRGSNWYGLFFALLTMITQKNLGRPGFTLRTLFLGQFWPIKPFHH